MISGVVLAAFKEQRDRNAVTRNDTRIFSFIFESIIKQFISYFK